jgi:hypothetical protein
MGRPQIASYAILPPKPKSRLRRTNTEWSALPSGAIYPQKQGDQGTTGQNHFDDEVWAPGSPASTSSLVPGRHKFFVGVSKLRGFDRH